MAQARQTNERTQGKASRETERPDEEMQDRSQQGVQDRGGLGINLTATTLRSLGHLYDMQAATARIVMRAQARAFSALGLPDYSHIFQVADDRTKRLFSSTTETLLQSSQHASSTNGEIQQHLGRLWEQQAMDLTETWRQGLEELQNQGTESLNELQELVRQQADEMAAATESLTDVTRETLREGGEQFRATVRQGFERTRDLTSRQAEATKREGERMMDATRQAAEELRSDVSEGAERATRPSKAA
jgi:hypothetical protein